MTCLARRIPQWTFPASCVMQKALILNRSLHTSGSSAMAKKKYSYSSKKVNIAIPVFLQAEQHVNKVALIDQNGSHTYGDLLLRSNCLTDKICDILKAEKDDINQQSIAFLCPNDASYIVSKWSTWMSGGMAVPLCQTHPTSELQYFLEDSQAKLVLTTEEFAEKVHPCATSLGIHHLVLDKKDFISSENELDVPEDILVRHMKRSHRHHQLLDSNGFRKRKALVIYTSGTTGRPKGVVHTFGSLHAQVTDMVESWNWTSSDTCLHVLPLHHIHGVVNMLITPCYVGATCVMLPKFDAKQVWNHLLGQSSSNPDINVFMAVPTIYAKLIESHEARLAKTRGRSAQRLKDFIKATCKMNIRLMVSGSAALPQPVLERWKQISGHTLLERYGMTETGMVLTNPLDTDRFPGAVGNPFPQVQVCIAQPNVYADKGYDVLAQGNHRRTKVTPGCEETSGELYVRGPNLFKEYYRKPDATTETFTKDGWFKTGDTAIYENGVYKILGRTSVDIIKSGGYKISALDVERHLLEHEDITDVAVVGLPDLTWGQRVAAVLVLRDGAPPDLSQETLKAWCKDRMAPYTIPTVVKVLDAMPRNAMGKVNKKDLVNTVFNKEAKVLS